MLLPPVIDPAQCAALRRDEVWVERVCAHFEAELGLSGPAIVYSTGSALSARFDDVVFKLFFPLQAQQARREATVHALLAERLSLDTPSLLDRGDVSGWRWLLTSVVSGSDLSDIWPSLALDARVKLGREVGRALAELHAQRPPGDLAVTWPVWSRVQISGAIDRHRRGGCPQAVLDQIPSYLAAADLTVGRRGIGLVHSAIRPEHLVVEQRGDTWGLTGLIGFAGAKVVPVDYEFGPIGVELARGDGPVLGAILESYGIDTAEAGLAERLFGLALIHDGADLGSWMREHARGAGTTLDELAMDWFSTTL